MVTNVHTSPTHYASGLRQLLLLVLLLTAWTSALSAATVQTAQGAVEGTSSRVAGVAAYLGLPYAAPPVGEARWRAPNPPVSWTGVRHANTFGNRCIQTDPFDDMIWNSTAESEDCLYLSIWAPEGAQNLPVMFWIHGGGYLSGAGDEERHDGSALASRGVVVVTINYRLGILGFLAHPDLTSESGSASSGNYAFLDMIAALRWVQENIGAFGGNPGNVTIFGESAGSFAVSTLMSSPLAGGLFHKAIGQSGAQFFDGQRRVPGLSEAEATGKNFADAAGAASISELRALPAAKLIAVSKNAEVPAGAIIDGLVIKESPDSVFAAGRQNDVPLMAGWTSAETKWVTQSLAEFRAVRQAQFADDLETATRLYPAETDEEAYQTAITLASDNWIAFATWKWIELQRAHGASPVYRFRFDQVMATPQGPVPENDPGAAHATDIPFVFNMLSYTGNPISQGDQATADLMADYWTNFAKSGDPNAVNLPRWPAFGNKGENRVMHLSASPGAEIEKDRERMEFLEQVNSRQAQ